MFLSLIVCYRLVPSLIFNAGWLLIPLLAQMIKKNYMTTSPSLRQIKTSWRKLSVSNDFECVVIFQNVSTPTEAQHSSVMAMMISLQRSLDNKLIPDKREEQFIKHSLNYLVSTSQQQAHIDSWTITSFEVEFGELIGSGGLSVNSLHRVEVLTS